MAKVVKMKNVPEVVHPDWLVKAGIHDYHEWLLSAQDTINVVYARIEPGANSGAPVAHDWTEEAAFVISGELVYVIGGKRLKVRANESIFIPAGEVHFVKNEGKVAVHRISIHLKKR